MRSLPKNGKLRSSKERQELGVAFHLWGDTKKGGQVAQLVKMPDPTPNNLSSMCRVHMVKRTNSCKFSDAHISATVLVCTSPTKK